MPSELLQALYQRQNERAIQLRALKPSLDIFEAVSVGDLERTRLLVAGDRLLAEATADDGFHPLHLAAYFGRSEVVRFLLDAGANPNLVASNSSLVRPLHSAISARHLAIARQLLEAGADPNARQQGGWTALHSAAHQGNAEAVRLLLEHGGDPRLAADDGRRPLDMVEPHSAPIESLLANA